MGGLTAVPALRMALAELAGRVPVVWDPHPHGDPPVPGCRLATPNEREASGFAPAAGVGAAAAAVLQQRWRCSAVAVTLGARGALLATPSGCLAVPAPDIAVPPEVDACGASDAFAAAVTGAVLDTSSVTEAVRVAVEEASRFVVDGGVASIDSPAGGSDLARSTSTARSAQDVVARLRRRGGRLVATGGCFDLLHPGHLSLLRQARALGDGLLFGPVSPQHWGPPPQRPQHVALWAGSTGDTFADRPDPGLLQITTADVLDATATARRLSPAPPNALTVSAPQSSLVSDLRSARRHTRSRRDDWPQVRSSKSRIRQLAARERCDSGSFEH